MKKEYIAPLSLIGDMEMETCLLDGSMSSGEGLSGDIGEARQHNLQELDQLEHVFDDLFN